MDDEYKLRLRHFFHELIKLGNEMPGRPGFGSPISWLLEQMCLYQDRLLARICGDFTRDSHEWRLNNAGLKLYWRIHRSENGCRGFVCHIGGDQAKDYPGFIVAAKNLIKEYNFDKGRY